MFILAKIPGLLSGCETSHLIPMFCRVIVIISKFGVSIGGEVGIGRGAVSFDTYVVGNNI